jgi:chemotaxis protein CheD
LSEIKGKLSAAYTTDIGSHARWEKPPLLIRPSADHSSEEFTVQLLGGHSFVAAEGNVVLTTVLGSCVAACLYDRRNRICGMNHFLLPIGGQRNPEAQGRFGDEAMLTLLQDILSLGASRRNITAGLYGGRRAIVGGVDIGGSNAELALQFLKHNGIPLTDTDLGGEATRWVRFHRSTGRAFVKSSRAAF